MREMRKMRKIADALRWMTIMTPSPTAEAL